MKFFSKLVLFGTAAVLSLGVLGAVVAAAGYFYLAPQLPSIEVLRDVRLQVPLRVFSRDGELIAEFGEQRRSPLRYEDIPDVVIQAVLAAEDDRFFEHPGVDYQGIARAALHLIRTGEKAQGGSTITMQVARNFFLSREKTYLRKVNEILLALKIERELSKEEILALYMNKIFLGNRAYGVAAASQVYYGTELENLTVAQVAMIAGLPKAPALYNPLVNPERATLRRNYVLGRMHLLGHLDEQEYRTALDEEDTARAHALAVEMEAPHIAEMVRAEMIDRYGNEAYTSGYRVYTTLDGRAQRAATRSLRQALLAYERRHGYRGPEGRVVLAEDAGVPEWEMALQGTRTVGGLPAGVVARLEEQSATIYTATHGAIEVTWEGLAWARPYIDVNTQGPAPSSAADILRVGDLVRVEPVRGGQWLLAQVPAAEGALVSLDPYDGAITSLVGGFDFYQSHFNRAVQALRQAGSNFKPFVYSAALEKGYTPASLINDAPVVFDDPGLEAAWRPENYSGRFYGPTRLREALVHSRNLVSIRLLRAIGIGYTINYSTRFGFERSRLPRDLSLSLGSGTVTPLEITAAYAVFANGGFRVEPYFIERIEDADGAVLFQADPAIACEACEQAEEAVGDHELTLVTLPNPTMEGDAALPVGDEPVPQPRLAERVIPAQNAYLMTSMLRDVVQRGTGRAALRLGRNDLAGKTGTTNDLRDAWFSGYNGDVVASAWVGFDTPRPLGEGETGGRAALPMWTSFVGQVLHGVPERPLVQPEGLVTVRIDPETSRLAAAGDPNAVFETFPVDLVPQASPEVPGGLGGGAATPAGGAGITEQLF